MSSSPLPSKLKAASWNDLGVTLLPHRADTPFPCMAQMVPHQQGVMGPSKQQPPLTSWVSRPKSLQMLFKLTLLIVFLKNGNLPNPRHKYWHQITCNHPRLPPTPYNLSVFYLPFKIEFHQMLWERKQEEQRQVLFGVLQFCCSFPQNVRLHMPCFNFGFNIYFSYRFLF